MRKWNESRENFANFSRKYENFRENFFTKIDANSEIIIDAEYLGNGASDWVLFTKVGILE
jgi:hypothetical protein